jgi:outer membrane protein OmpA-like peptidoglycan-associated protein
MRDSKAEKAMRHLVSAALAALALAACGGGTKSEPQAPEAETPAAGSEAPEEGTSGDGVGQASAAGDTSPSNEFQLAKSDSAKEAHGASESKIKPTRTEAAMKFIVVDKDKGPIKGVVVSLTAPDGKKYYTEETDMQGYAEVLVPVGQTYELMYLSLGQQDITARVPVTDEPNQNVKLTLRYKLDRPPPPPQAPMVEPGFVLEGIQFDTGKATIKPESLPRFNNVLEYMQHKKSARIEISGHTDNVGNPRANKALSDKRAKACRDYLISKGIDGSRIEAVGYGDARPIASNDSEGGRQENRRIEAREL